MSTLTRAEQQTIVHDLLQTLERDIINGIKQDRVPAGWTGHELRQYIVDRAAEQIIFVKMSPTKLKAYRNDVLVNNL